MPLRIAHRGAAGTHPENTMAAFRRAVEIGVDGIEFDVHRTMDGHLVVIHDASVERTTDGSGLVMAMTLEEVQALDAGAKKGPEFAGERVPTLRELIRSTSPEVFLFLELKAGSVHYPGIEEELVALLKEEGAMQRTQVSSFDHHALKRLHEIEPDLPLGMLFTANLLDPVALAREIGCEALHPAWEWVTEEMVEKAHAAGLKVNTWTVNHPFAIARVQVFGVDGIMSDYPELLQG
ncbi:MAG: glycerophosphodiester phosphodiesterase [Bacillota bacterium]